MEPLWCNSWIFNFKNNHSLFYKMNQDEKYLIKNSLTLYFIGLNIVAFLYYAVGSILIVKLIDITLRRIIITEIVIIIMSIIFTKSSINS